MAVSLVVVRDFRGLPNVAQVWRDRGDYVDVVACGACPGEVEGLDIHPIGIPRADVFVYDPKVVETGDWHSARPF
jgi:hypothetical protein